LWGALRMVRRRTEIWEKGELTKRKLEKAKAKASILCLFHLFGDDVGPVQRGLVAVQWLKGEIYLIRLSFVSMPVGDCKAAASLRRC
jgi:hypothetical protein